ncbi:MAG: FIST C-terminal domain-containing protein [Coriobacteriia bacterium]|nr:FIST C-terminal domain-containing protein [Coriobacteriia bacterium]
MLKCASIYTCEVDNPDVALVEIQAQLDEKISLLRHSVGVIMCHTEFITTGVLEHICAHLPFDVVGVTTASQAVNDEVSELVLTIFVMTSSDVEFITGATGSLEEQAGQEIKAAYDKCSAGVEQEPQLVLVFPPFGIHPVDMYVNEWTSMLSRTPVFGTPAIDDTATFSECETIYNGKHSKTSMPFILCYGNINPRFLIATFSESNAVTSKAVVTKSVGNCVFEINNAAAYKYYEDKGIVDSVPLTPFMIESVKRQDYDGVPVIYAHTTFTDEGAEIFYGGVEEGSTITLLKYEPDDIVSAAKQKMELVNEMSDINGVLLFSCAIRRFVLLGVNKPMQELQSVRDTLRPGIPFMMGYAGGEICPTSIRDGVPVNRFHNYSLIILVI